MLVCHVAAQWFSTLRHVMMMMMMMIVLVLVWRWLTGIE
jgi:hypothetical protein